jgi:hypothetical protein
MEGISTLSVSATVGTTAVETTTVTTVALITVQGITTVAGKAVVIRTVGETVDMEVMRTSMMIVPGAEAGAALGLLVGAAADAAATMMDTTLMIITTKMTTVTAAAVVERVRGVSEAGMRVTLMCPRVCSIDGVRQLKVWRGGWI